MASNYISDQDYEEDNSIQDENDENTKAKILDSIENIVSRLIDGLINDEPLVLPIKYRVETSNVTATEKQVNFLHARSCRRFSLYIKCLSFIYNLIENDLYSTKRDLYYQYKEYFEDQTVLNNMIDDIAATLNVQRSSLNILSSNKGLVAGYLEIIDSNDNYINCQYTNSGFIIPHCIESIKGIRAKAKFMLIVEKDATFQRLLDDGFLNNHEAILITGKGMPDLCTRKLANLIWKKYNLPSYCLIDANPYGIQIMIVYKYGSFSIQHEKESLTIPNLKFIGLNIKDFEKISFKLNNITKLSEQDKNKAKNLLNKDYINNEPELKEQLDYMLNKNVKADIQCLQSISNKFLSEIYLPMKLKFT